MSLFEKAQATEAKARNAGAQQATESVLIDLDQMEAFADALETAFPNLALNTKAIEGQGLAPDGVAKMVPFAAIQKLPVPGSVTVYYNGKCVLAGALVGFEHDALHRQAA